MSPNTGANKVQIAQNLIEVTSSANPAPLNAAEINKRLQLASIKIQIDVYKQNQLRLKINLRKNYR